LNGGKDCEPVLVEDCNQDNPCPVDCVEKFGEWAACSVTCDAGVQRRSYDVITARVGSGVKCTEDPQKFRACLDSPPCVIDSSNGGGKTAENETAGSNDDGGGGFPVMVVVGAGAGIVLLLLVFILVFRRRRKSSSLTVQSRANDSRISLADISGRQSTMAPATRGSEFADNASDTSDDESDFSSSSSSSSSSDDSDDGGADGGAVVYL
jgi:hypothetical protein